MIGREDWQGSQTAVGWETRCGVVDTGTHGGPLRWHYIWDRALIYSWVKKGPSDQGGEMVPQGGAPYPLTWLQAGCLFFLLWALTGNLKRKWGNKICALRNPQDQIPLRRGGLELMPLLHFSSYKANTALGAPRALQAFHPRGSSQILTLSWAERVPLTLDMGLWKLQVGLPLAETQDQASSGTSLQNYDSLAEFTVVCSWPCRVKHQAGSAGLLAGTWASFQHGGHSGDGNWF